MTPPAAARSALGELLESLVDYAGLFPPAALPMRDAVRSYEEYRNGSTAWALGRFVVTVARLAEFEETLTAAGVTGPPWRLSVLAAPGDRGAVDEFNARVAGRALIDTVEGKATSVTEIAELAVFGPAITTYVEIPLIEDPTPLVIAIGEYALRAKIRTGGVTEEAFPAAAQVARFLAICAAHEVPFKATAGLHHPWHGVYRLSYDPRSPGAAMFGFVGVFLAACFLHEGMAESEAIELLEERGTGEVTFDGADVRWRGHAIGAARLRDLRSRFATSFGSCSFTEPIDDLMALGLL